MAGVMSTARFHPVIREWFERKFGLPTEAQAQGWAAVAEGRHTLIAAPTGSGKTLAAFLTCIDRLVRQGLEGGLPDATQVVYVSPLKALSNDIRKNLTGPLEEIAALGATHSSFDKLRMNGGGDGGGVNAGDDVRGVNAGSDVGRVNAGVNGGGGHLGDDGSGWGWGELGGCEPLPADGVGWPEIRIGVRTGDTGAAERRAMAKKPPHILITTPESLYILLTSVSGRQGLRGVNTLILDEIHAVADDKRGSHLSLSVERLCALSEGPVVRIGLSATQRPIEEIARLLVGNEFIGADGRAACAIVDTGHARELDLALQLPEQELGPIASHELWGETLDAVAGLAQEHETTLVFVNTRKLVERVSFQLSARLGEDAVAAHHGSLSRATRLDAEERLKSGQVKVCVATASLELGIDIGDIDLVCQIGSPRSIGVLLQRVGRSGHWVGGTPKGRLFPLTRDELAECVALCRAVRRRNLDTLSIPPWPVDVLAQQVVAACAQEEWGEDDLYALFRRSYPYRELPRGKFDQVIETLAEGFARRQGRGAAYLHRDGVNGKVKGRRGAPLAAMTSGGAIPENADYDVIAEPEDTFVGTVNEDFAIESMRGDVFLLGNNAWKIRRVESGRVRVEDAHGQPPTIPFWLGEAPGRTGELSEEVSELREGIDRLLSAPPPFDSHSPEGALKSGGEWNGGDAARSWVCAEAGVDAEASRQLVAYIEEGRRVLGVTPSKKRVVAERFFDESGGMQLVIHAPFGAKINRAWGMALRKKICRSFDFELQAAATDDGLNFALGPGLSMPVEDIFSYLKPATIEEVLTQAVLQAPIFGTRWRWNATRALAILRHTGGKKVPPPLQRMRSDDLLAAVFPAQAACQDNAPPGDIEVPDHPLVFETMRDCLTEASDLAGCRAVLAGIESGDIEVCGRDTVQPSVFSHQILNAMPYAFLDDAPLEERRARAVPLRRALPENSRDLTRLDPEAIRQESENAWPRIRDADELHDALLTLGVLPDGPDAPLRPPHSYEAEGGLPLQPWLEQLAGAGRICRVATDSGLNAWAAMERLGLVRTAYDGLTAGPPAIPPGAVAGKNGGASLPLFVGGQYAGSREDAILALARGWVDCIGPFTAGELAATLALPPEDVAYALGQLENEGVVLRGSYRPPVRDGKDGGIEFCDRRILARIHRATIDSLRRQIEPVSAAAFIRFLMEWQHVAPEARLRGEGGLLAVIEKLQGFESAAGVMEEEILGVRVADYSGLLLDRLCLSGEVVWGRFSARHNGAGNGAGNGNGGAPGGRGAFSRFTPVTLALRESLDWLLPPAYGDGNGDGGDGLAGAPKEALAYLLQRGASFQSDIVAATKRLPSDVEEALWTLAAAGLVTADGLEALRQRLRGTVKRPRRTSSGDRFRMNGRNGLRVAPGRGGLPSAYGYGGGSRPAFAAPPESANPMGGRGPRGFSRWWALESVDAVGADDARAEAAARQLLLRYGVLFPELLGRDALSVRWRDLARVLRRLEARGEIRGGRFVAGFVGEQFALPEAADALRRRRNEGDNRATDARLAVISACDPLNLAGILTPGPRVAATPGNRLAYRDGIPIAAMEGGQFVVLSNAPGGVLEQARTLLSVPVAHANFRMQCEALATA